MPAFKVEIILHQEFSQPSEINAIYCVCLIYCTNVGDKKHKAQPTSTL